MGKNNGERPQGTEYIVLRRSDRGWSEFPNVQTSYVSRAGGAGAIKQATKREDGSFEGGTFKAVPTGTWDSETNNLETETETKVVSSFKKPTPLKRKVATNAPPARTPDPK